MGNQFSGTDPASFDVGGDRRNDLFDALSHPRRRFALQYLQTALTPCSVDELTTELVAWEVQRPVAERTGEDRDAIALSLVHNHLPKLDDAGFVDYDVTSRTVTLADRTAEVEAHLQVVSDD